MSANYDLAVAIPTLIGSLLSCIASGLIFVCYMLIPKQQHFRHTLILNLAGADFFNSLNNSLSGIYVFYNDRLTPGGACTLNGWVGQLTVQGTDVSILFIAIATVLALNGSDWIPEVTTRNKVKVSAALWFLPLTTSGIALILDAYAPVSGNWCWITSTRQDLRYGLTHAWRMTIIAITIGVYVYLYIYLRKEFKKVEELSQRSDLAFQTNNDVDEMEEIRHDIEQPPPPPQPQSVPYVEPHMEEELPMPPRPDYSKQYTESSASRTQSMADAITLSDEDLRLYGLIYDDPPPLPKDSRCYSNINNQNKSFPIVDHEKGGSWVRPTILPVSRFSTFAPQPPQQSQPQPPSTGIKRSDSPLLSPVHPQPTSLPEPPPLALSPPSTSPMPDSYGVQITPNISPVYVAIQRQNPVLIDDVVHSTHPQRHRQQSQATIRASVPFRARFSRVATAGTMNTTRSRQNEIQKVLLLNAYPIAYVILWIPGILNRILELSGNQVRILNVLQSSTQYIGLANALTYGFNEGVKRQLQAWRRERAKRRVRESFTMACRG